MQLQLSTKLWEDIHQYLASRHERALFLFAKEIETETGVWQPVDKWFLNLERDYDKTSELHVALAPHVMPTVFKRAHDADAAVVEVHGHYWPGDKTCLSPYDVAGLQELVPQMLWRLPSRPYFALVVGMDSFDGLVWSHRDQAQTVKPLLIGFQELVPTGESLSVWEERMDTLNERLG